MDFLYTDIKDFTNNVSIDNITFDVTGSGIFDTLMETATKHLTAQFNAGRIRQEDFATAYIDIYKYTLQAALEEWLKRGQIEAEIEKIKADTEVSKVQKDKLLADINYTNAQKEKTEAETLIIPLQGDKIKSDIKYTNAQIEESKEKLKLLAKQLELLAKQLETEDAKKALYRRQIEGFDEDYKQKILKIMMESWAVGFSVAKDSFEATGIPAPMQKVTIDDLYNQYILTELDKYSYGRSGAIK